jgi:hypothetical protein
VADSVEAIIQDGKQLRSDLALVVVALTLASPNADTDGPTTPETTIAVMETAVSDMCARFARVSVPDRAARPSIADPSNGDVSTDGRTEAGRDVSTLRATWPC